MSIQNAIYFLEKNIFGNKALVVSLFVTITALMAYSASNLKVDAGFAKLLPLKHEYMQTFVKHRQRFGGANRVLVGVVARDGNMFTPAFFNALKQITDEVFFIPGVDRSQVSSLFTPNVRFTEVIEDGIAGGNVIPAGFQASARDLALVRENIIKAGIVGRLVANDFSGAIVSAQLLEIDPSTGKKLDYTEVAQALEEKIRSRYQSDDLDIELDIHIIGFAKVMGDISEGVGQVIGFFLIAFLITAALVYLYAMSLRVALIPLACSLVAVIWQLGILPLLGFGLDPMSILVPFLVFAIGVSHGVQMISAVAAEIEQGDNQEDAARTSFRKLLIPGTIALISDTIGFITILLIDIGIIREMAITASIGVAVIILTNLILLPVLMCYLKQDQQIRDRLTQRSARLAGVWNALSQVAERHYANKVIAIALILLACGLWKGLDIKIGDLQRGVPELHANSRYNLDSEAITQRFSIGVDVLSVIVETIPEGCIDYDVMSLIDDFAWHMQNVDGVQSVVTLSKMAKLINAGWNEGSLEWRVLSRNPQVLAQATSYIDTSSGLLNEDCSVMPVLIFTKDHKAETIDRIVAAVKSYRDAFATKDTHFMLASSNVGVMAATNEAVAAAQFPMLIYVFSAIILLCLISFRSVPGTLCIILPLALVSLLAYALMSLLEIGLKVNTLPVVALGVGIGVDYGIYIFSRFQALMRAGCTVSKAYEETLKVTGFGVVFTAITLGVGVVTWIFSPLKFQADMGILLTFMFVVNMLGAIFLLPALAAWLFKPVSRKSVNDRKHMG